MSATWSAADQAAHRQVLADAGLIPRYHCLPCLRGEHGQDCQGGRCPCRCRAMLGLAGPFPGRDPTAPTDKDRWVA